MLHPHFVVALLNDVYGIQARAGCSCTGPYSHRLLDIDSETSERARSLVKEGYNAFKFGWARVNFNYFISPEEVEFICDAILQIAEHGWKLLPLYEADLKSALFVHRRKNSQRNRPSLANLQLSATESAGQGRENTKKPKASSSFKKVLEDAQKMYGAAEKFLRLFGQYEENKFQESLPTDIISPNDIWWVSTKDVLDDVKSGLPSAPTKNSRPRQDAWSMALTVEC